MVGKGPLDIRTVRWKKLPAVIGALVASVFLLGSSVTFCDTGDTYNKAYDQSDEYSSRWYSGQEQITPEWTPDGSHIVFGHAGRIYVVDANGSKLQSLSGSFEPAGLYSETAEIDFSPSVSPDGARVAYTTLRYATGALYEHTYEIATQGIDGSDRQRLTNNTWNDVSPAWSPDGSRIAYVSHREDGPRVFTMTSDGSDGRSVGPSINAQTGAPVWSPDGSRLAFVAQGGPIYGEAVYTVSADGSNLTKLDWAGSPDVAPRIREGVSDLTSPEEEVATFQWSPDGGHIALVARYYGELDSIYVASPDGSEIRRVFSLSDVAESEEDKRDRILGISWSPAGDQISFEAGGFRLWFHRGVWHTTASVYTVSADGSELRLVIDKDSLSSYLEWPDKIVGPGPRRIVRYIESTGPNVEAEVKGRILSTIAWGGSDEKVLVRIEGDRVVAASP